MSDEHCANNHRRAVLHQSERGDAGGKENLEPITHAGDFGGRENLLADLGPRARLHAKPRLKPPPVDVGRLNLFGHGRASSTHRVEWRKQRIGASGVAPAAGVPPVSSPTGTPRAPSSNVQSGFLSTTPAVQQPDRSRDTPVTLPKPVRAGSADHEAMGCPTWSLLPGRLEGRFNGRQRQQQGKRGIQQR